MSNECPCQNASANIWFSSFGFPSTFVIRASSLLPMRFVEIAAPDFDLEKTLNSGQVFHWERAGGGFVGTIGNLPVHVEQQQRDVLRIRSSEIDRLKRSSLERTIEHYFALDHPLQDICRSFPNDATM